MADLKFQHYNDARKLSDTALGAVDDAHQRASIESEDWFDDSLVEDLQKNNVFWVTFTPDYSFFHHKGMLVLNGFGDTKTSGRLMPAPNKRLPHSQSNQLAEKALGALSRGKTKRKFPISRWRIEVGFLHPFEKHENPSGTRSVETGRLILFLLALGYDPLYTIRQDSYIRQIRIEMARVILKAMSDNRSDGSPLRIRSRLERIARVVQDYAKDFLEGGAKPPLDSSTIRTRRYNANNYDTPYASGIVEPLQESGQLEMSIYYRVIGENPTKSEEIRAKIEEAKIARRAKLAEQREARRWVAHKEPATAARVVRRAKIADANIAEDLDREIAQSRGSSISNDAIKSGRFVGLSPRSRQGAVSIIRIIKMLGSGVSARNDSERINKLMDSNVITGEDAIAFKLASDYVKEQARLEGMTPRDYFNSLVS